MGIFAMIRIVEFIIISVCCLYAHYVMDENNVGIYLWNDHQALVITSIIALILTFIFMKLFNKYANPKEEDGLSVTDLEEEYRSTLTKIKQEYIEITDKS